MNKKDIEACNLMLRNEDVKAMCKIFFDVDISPKQEEVVRAIAFEKSRRIVVSAFTRYGKSYCVAMGVCLYVLLHKDQRIMLIAPIQQQTGILRNYISEFLLAHEEFRNLLDIELRGLDRLKSEVSKSRITFKNGNQLVILSAEGTAERLMGWGGGLIILDESCLVDYEVYRQRISRMLGDHPDSTLVEIGNPWHRNNQMYEHWCDPAFLKIHIGYQDGITEGRITAEFVEEQRKLLTPTEFTVLYEADFPEEAEDQLIKREWVMSAIKRPLNLINPKRILGLDVAEFGRDWTVLTIGETDGSLYRVMDIKSWSKQDTMVTVGHVSTHIQDGRIKVDAIGVGSGVASRLSELNYNVLAVKVGEGAEEAKKLSENQKKDALTERSRYSNKKAQYYWELRELFEQGRISIPDNVSLIGELLKMRYELNSSARIKIVDPEKSPDYSDSLMLFCAETKRPKFIFDFGATRTGEIY